MGWAVGWCSDNRRFRGYGVPAYCDAKGCRNEIDRGLGFVCDCDRIVGDDGYEEACWAVDALDKIVFVCSEHTCADVDPPDLPPEHPEWVAHVLNDESWSEWRMSNPRLVEQYEAMTA
jgi:hypothetical protein